MTISLGMKTGTARRYQYKNTTYIVSSSFTVQSEMDRKRSDKPRTLKSCFETALIQDQLLTGISQMGTIDSIKLASDAGKEKYASEA